MSTLPRDGFAGRGRGPRRKPLIIGGVVLALIVVWSYAVLSYGGGEQAKSTSPQGGGRPRSRPQLRRSPTSRPTQRVVAPTVSPTATTAVAEAVTEAVVPARVLPKVEIVVLATLTRALKGDSPIPTITREGRQTSPATTILWVPAPQKATWRP
ncbi:MAG: hypothetical protein ACFB50_13370 [Rubrobacteraceae bacterium]